MTTMIPVAAYLRVSTGKQAEGELSIPDQRRAIQDFCRDRGWKLVAEYIDHVSASDEDKRRPEFERMVDEGVRGTVGFKKIVVHSYSRYFRVAFQGELYRRKLLKVGIDIVSITQQFGEGDTADLVRQVVSVFDEFQTKEIRKHVKRTMLLNAQLGFLNGRVPYGYKAVEAGIRGDSVKKKAEPEEDKEAPNVRIIFQLALKGLTGADSMGVREISKEVHRRGIRTRTGRSFNSTQIHEILTNTAYIGRLVWGRFDHRQRKDRSSDEWVIIAVPPIIDEDTFEAVQAKMRARDPKRNQVRFTPHPTLLSGLACCGTCERTMTGVSGKSGQYRYYKCSKAERYIDGGCDEPRIIPQGILDDLVVDHLSEIVFEPNRLRLVLEEAMEGERAERDELPRNLEKLIRRKSTLEGQIARLLRAVAVAKLDPQDPLFADQMGGLQAERVQVQEQIAIMRSVESEFPTLTAARVREFSDALRTAIRTGEPRVRRTYLRFFLKRVVVNQEQVRLEGHKNLLAKAYGREWQETARAVGGKRAVLPQVGGWWSRGGSNP